MQHTLVYLVFGILILACLMVLFSGLKAEAKSLNDIVINEDVKDEDNRKLLVLRNWNDQAGLHFMGVYVVMVAEDFARRRNLRLVVILDSGLYFESDPSYQHQYKIDPLHNEWFSYYFRPHGIDDLKIRSWWQRGLLDKLPSGITHNIDDTDEETRHILGWNYDYATFARRRNEDVNFRSSFARNIRLQPSLQSELDDFIDRHNMRNRFLIGMHMRLTDKYGDATGSEDNPIHFEYERYAKALIEEAHKHLPRHPNLGIVLASDEEPAVEYVKAAVEKAFSTESRSAVVVIVADGVLRSKINTSGLQLDSGGCRQEITIGEHPDCQVLRDLAEASIHRGYKTYSNYRKGWEAVFEVFLLAQCNVFFKSRGNFSNSIVYAAAHGDKMKVIDMVNAF